MPPLCRYYQCAHGQPYEYTCAAGTLWSQALMSCDWAANVQCQGPATQGPATQGPATQGPATQGPATTAGPVATTAGPGEGTNGPSGGCLKDKIYYDHGEVTAYGNNPTGGHCGFTELPSDEAKKHFVAISSQDAEGWKDGLYCGSCVRLKYTDGHVSQQISSFHDTSPRN